jgi:hypothetical protein
MSALLNYKVEIEREPVLAVKLFPQDHRDGRYYHIRYKGSVPSVTFHYKMGGRSTTQVKRTFPPATLAHDRIVELARAAVNG